MRTIRRQISAQNLEAALRQAHIDRRKIARRDSIPNHSVIAYRARSSTSINDGARGVRRRQRRHRRANARASRNRDDNGRYQPSNNDFKLHRSVPLLAPSHGYGGDVRRGHRVPGRSNASPGEGDGGRHIKDWQRAGLCVGAALTYRRPHGEPHRRCRNPRSY